MILRLKAPPVDWSLLMVMFALIVVGSCCLYSTAAGSNQSVMNSEFSRQILWFILGLLILIGVLYIPINVLYRSSYILYGISLALLVAVLFLGSGDVHRWIRLGGFGFQPSELAKISTILAVSRYIADGDEIRLRWKRFLGSLLLASPPLLLILKEPDVGTSFVFIFIWLTICVWAGIEMRIIIFMLIPVFAFAAGFSQLTFIVFMFILIVTLVFLKQRLALILSLTGVNFIIGLIAPALWSRLEPYQQQRILIFLGMKSDPHGVAYQLIQSKVAVGSGGIIGKGLLHGSQTQLRFLPEQQTDFIFTVLAEEMGFVGVIILFGLFFMLFVKILDIARKARNRFYTLVAVGSFSVLTFQFFINIGMTVGLVPITGLPLPFLSYGGSSLLVSMILVGLAANISGNKYKY